MFAGLGVIDVAEEDEVRHLVDPHPPKISTAFGERRKFLDSCTVFRDGCVTEHALIRLGQPGPLSPGCAGVAIEALDTGAAVDLVAEGDGLGSDLDREFLDLALVGGLCDCGQGPAADSRHEEREAGCGKLQQADLSAAPPRYCQKLISFG